MSNSQLDRRKFLTVGAIGVATSAVGLRAVMAQDEGDSTPTAGATPGATPGASPEAQAAGGNDEAVTVVAVDIDFEPAEFTIPADTDVEITVDNEGALQHDFIIEDTDFATELLDGGESETITVNLEAGEYVYYCSVPGHREAGMEGTLTVE